MISDECYHEPKANSDFLSHASVSSNGSEALVITVDWRGGLEKVRSSIFLLLYNPLNVWWSPFETDVPVMLSGTLCTPLAPSLFPGRSDDCSGAKTLPLWRGSSPVFALVEIGESNIGLRDWVEYSSPVFPLL